MDSRSSLYEHSYHTFPKRLYWEDLDHLLIYHGVPIARELQYRQSQQASIGKRLHIAYIEQLPELHTFEETITTDKVRWQNCFKVGIRVKKIPGGHRAPAAPEGALVKLDWCNEDESDHHIEDESKFWMGRVEPRSETWLKATGCDFCVLASRPRRDRTNIKVHPAGRPEVLPDIRLPKLRIMVQLNRMTAQRELDALKRFCNWDFEPRMLKHVRMAFMSNPSRSEPKEDEYIDLTYGPKHHQTSEHKEIWNRIMAEYRQTRHDNPSQIRVLESPAHMPQRLLAIRGLPGVGKTSTITDLITALTRIGHKCLCVGPSDAAIDHLAGSVYKALGAEGRPRYKCLRLEADEAEKAASLAKMSIQDCENGGYLDKIERAETTGKDRITAARNTLDNLVADIAERVAYMLMEAQKARDKARVWDDMHDLEAINGAYERIEQEVNARRGTLPNGMALDYHAWELLQEDKVAAEAQSEQIQVASDPRDSHMQPQASEVPAVHLDKSAQYRNLISQYIRTKGKLDEKTIGILQNENDIMVKRVLKATDVLFTTASNAAGELLTSEQDSFKPSIIIYDEGGQVSIPSFCVPLTNFPKAEGVFVIGDTMQFLPIVTSGKHNEFAANARISSLAMLTDKNYPILLLDTTYRLCPALASFPNQQFYDGTLKLHASTKIDTRYRKAMREVSLEWAKLAKSTKGAGSEYMFIDVTWGASQYEVNGDSLVNFANAKADLMAMHELLKRHIEPSVIKILTYYPGQQRLLQNMLAEAEEFSDEVKRQVEISTVDAFQGKESQIVILDLVIARDPLRKLFSHNKGRLADANCDEEDEPDELDDETENYIRIDRITGYIRSPNRLNVALTRGIAGCIVVAQQSILCRDPMRRKGNKLYHSLMNMATNADVRGLMFHLTHEDDHPRNRAFRRSLGKTPQEQAQVLRKRRAELDLEFIQVAKQKSAVLREERQAPPEAPPLYRTPGHTTRPLSDRKLREEADAHDKEI